MIGGEHPPNGMSLNFCRLDLGAGASLMITSTSGGRKEGGGAEPLAGGVGRVCSDDACRSPVTPRRPTSVAAAAKLAALLVGAHSRRGRSWRHATATAAVRM